MFRLILSALFIFAGVNVIITALVGNFRFGYVLNRMQVGATADTMGAILVLIGLIIKVGWSMISLKLSIMIIWSSSWTTDFHARMQQHPWVRGFL